MSSRLRLKIATRPKVRDKVVANCSLCGLDHTIVFRDLLRTINIQAEIGVGEYHCPSCFRSTEQYRHKCKLRSLSVIDKIVAGASARSQALWLDENYRSKTLEAHKAITSTDVFSAAVSAGIKTKFTDPVYKQAIKEARKHYWDKLGYRNTKTWSKDEFIIMAMREHGDKYDYSNVNYINIKQPVTIICKTHGPFIQRPSHHIFYGNGCPTCARKIELSKPQLEIYNWLMSLGYVVELNNTKLLDGLELDLFLPDYGVAIEYHGGFWHSYQSIETAAQKYRHYRKANLSLGHNIKLLQFFDVEWRDRRDIVESMILYRLKHTMRRIYARQCVWQQLDRSVASEFINLNHLSGYTYAENHYGLLYNDELVSVLSITNRGHYHELIRFCSKIGTSVVGALSKLLSKVDFDRLMTYADRRYSDASGYIASGFVLEKITRPGYYYWRNNKIYNRRKFQKHKLDKLLAVFDPDITEAENMLANGYRRIWDAGHFKLWLKKIKYK